MVWNSWIFERFVILFASVAFLLLAIQVTLFHYRQNFHRKVMWVPVIATPLFFVIGTVLSLYPAQWLFVVFQCLMWIGVVIGLVGFYFHWRGVGTRVGGRALRNFLIGPPVILPLFISAMSALSLCAMYWRV